MNLHTELIQVGVTCRVVYKLWKLSLAHLRCAVTKHKEECADCVGFPRTIRNHDGRKGLSTPELIIATCLLIIHSQSYLVKWANLLSPCVTLEIDEHHLIYYKIWDQIVLR